MKEIKETCEICGYELSEAQNNKHNHEDTDSLMANYEKTKKEGIEEFRNKFPQTKIVVMVEGDAEEIFLADMLEELASSFAEKIKEAVEKDDRHDFGQEIISSKDCSCDCHKGIAVTGYPWCCGHGINQQ